MKPWLERPVPFGTWLATCLVIGLLLGGGVWLYTRLQVARVDAIERLCLVDNGHSRDNIRFIQKVNPHLVPLARRTFKINTNCHEFAREAASQPPPQPGAP